MGDDSSRRLSQETSLQDQWPLSDSFRAGDLPAMKPQLIEDMMRRLSKERQKTHQQLERISKEIELLQLKMESLKIVGGDLDESVDRINQLTESGYNLTQKLEKIDSRLKEIRHKSQENLETEDWV
jgi:hypothetical protein